MKHMFVYGSLMFDVVWSRLIRHRYDKLHAESFGYKRLKVKGEAYPGLIRCKSSTTEGVLVLNVKPQDISILDQFEGEYYERVTVKTSTPDRDFNAEAYLFKKKYRHLLADSEWDVDRFREETIHEFITKYTGF